MWSLPSKELTISRGKWSHMIINGAHSRKPCWVGLGVASVCESASPSQGSALEHWS